MRYINYVLLTYLKKQLVPLLIDRDVLLFVGGELDRSCVHGYVLHGSEG